MTVKEFSYGSAISEKAALGLDAENSWNIDYELAVDDAYRMTYNTKNKSFFRTLPEGVYSFKEQMSLPSGTTKTELDVTINTSQLQPGDYMLPIRIKTVSVFEISSTNAVYPFTIRYKRSMIILKLAKERGVTQFCSPFIILRTD